MKLVHNNHLTDTIHHRAVKMAWLNDIFDKDQLKPAYSKITMMLGDCSTKPSNGAKLDAQFSNDIGKCFYLTPDKQHHHDLDLAE
jgi:hypothetical protein